MREHSRFFLPGLSIVVLAIFFLPLRSASASQPETGKILTQMPPPLKMIQRPIKNWEVFSDNYYEYSGIRQDGRAGSWSEITNMFGYGRGNAKGYFSISQLRRFGERDYTANFGAYLSMKNSYLHFETGFGWDIRFIYRLQEIIEYAHKLYKGLYWQAGYNYRAYPVGDTHLIYPGLIYYFGNSYISANYGCSIIQYRGPANMGSIKGDFYLNKYLTWWVGGAIGDRLYDIDGLPAQKEFGYIAFTGFTCHLNKDVAARVGFTYGYEKPDFDKRSVMSGLYFQF